MNENISSVSVNGVPIKTRGYQQEMLDESLRRNIIIAMDTGSGKTHIAVLRLKHESERELEKVSFSQYKKVGFLTFLCSSRGF
ncbi:hypothetical protein GYMLUDRAFT_51333 [Collybiopsis luxurians FD-317 M1]|uniref:Helicase/UvrB N-terminal domain-containing protein n=1 Tax=Collybiopsis luxurians FD-317 M1 TaxID=944289 RepID=A0A0D0BXQ5_9AGAR|nr:hypothetical protein GYMLUDRAFT_51333 [Collybiopsis luxurians FD-317 M1]